MLYTGMRVGEVTGLTKNDILEDDISVNHTLVYYDKRTDKSNKMTYSINSTKTEAGKRMVLILPQVREALDLEDDYLEKAEIKRKAVVDGYTDFVFVNRFGENLNQGTLNKALRRIARDYNLQEIDKAKEERREALLLPKISTRTLRHTFATRMMEKGVILKVMQDTLGHSDIRVTLEIYTEVQKDFRKDELNKLSDL